MLIQRETLLRHLTKVYCDGQIGEVVLQPDFSVVAMPHTQQMLVVAPALEEIDPLPHSVGVLDLEILIKSLSPPGAQDDDELSIEFTKNRIHIEERHRGRSKMVTADPRVISTQVEDGMLEAFSEALPDGGDNSVALSQTVVLDVLHKMSLLPASSVGLKVSPEGSCFHVGQPDGHNYDTDIDTLKLKETYELRFDHAVFKAVLRQVNDFTQSRLVVAGPDQLIKISEGGYQYLISPMQA